MTWSLVKKNDSIGWESERFETPFAFPMAGVCLSPHPRVLLTDRRLWALSQIELRDKGSPNTHECACFPLHLGGPGGVNCASLEGI